MGPDRWSSVSGNHTLWAGQKSVAARWLRLFADNVSIYAPMVEFQRQEFLPCFFVPLSLDPVIH